MIPLATDFDLGKDHSRIKDRRDGERQARTAEVLLNRLFADDPDQRWELQLLADEVGMGKTFVALAVAYSLLMKMRAGLANPDLRGCVKRVLVIAPQPTLAQKWVREVGEFVRRCVADSAVARTRRWFRAENVDRSDDLVRALRVADGPAVVVTTMGALTDSRKLKHYDSKRRLLLGVLFRFWGARFKLEARERLLRGAPRDWPRRQDELTAATDEDWSRTAFEDEEDMLAAVRAFADAGGSGDLDALLDECRAISEPHVRGREARFQSVEQGLNRVYRPVCYASLRAALPLVLVDEAHHWKNGPSQKTNGYAGFERYIAPITRRAVLLTATPFQLRPDEMLELLRVGSVITPCFTADAASARRQRVEAHREAVLRPVLEGAARQSRAFAAAWSRLSRVAAAGLETAWCSPGLVSARGHLAALAHPSGDFDLREVDRIAEGAVVGQPVELRDLLREALRLFASNTDLSRELGTFVIRHRRRTDHRLFRVGAEYVATDDSVLRRSDRAALHAAPGIDVRGDAELPHYLLMRCVTEMKHGRGRSSLGTALTGCYSTLLVSADGRAIRDKLERGASSRYFELLRSMVDASRDPNHPKVRAVVDAAMSAWHRGDKMLIFCFRTHTAKRLEELLSQRISRELASRRQKVLDGAKGLQRLRGRITRRDGDLAPLALDRVLWSLRWAARAEDVALPPFDASDLRLTDEELEPLAVLSLRYDIDLLDDRPDRVFLHRAVEHLIAKRLASRRPGTSELAGRIIDAIADEAWVRTPYGATDDDTSAASDGDDALSSQPHQDSIGLDERGVHASYPVKVAVPDRGRAAELAKALRERRLRARRTGQVPLVDNYADGPSFWLGEVAEQLHQGDPGSPAARAVAAMHRHLLSLTRNGPGLDWKQRLLVFQALRRAVLRESVLVRILPARSDLDEQGWGDVLVERLFAPWQGQRESTADRLAVFLEDLKAADGAVYEHGTSRHNMYEATRMRDTRFVVLVAGDTTQDRRERVFAGFNSPLLPEVMICTSVGQEGIDLHRHCRHVVHYDLAWNPAVLEQRIGRVDRIGSKTFRERLIDSASGQETFLEVGVPFLAGTYDERMYEEIRIRAQTFEVLTGGDVAADNLEGRDDEPGAEGQEENLAFVTLPRAVIADLRVRLFVWEPSEG